MLSPVIQVTWEARTVGWSEKAALGIHSSVFLSNCSFFANKWSNKRFAQKNEWFAHFWWATWAIGSWSLIFSERREWIAHGRSFLVSDLSDLLTLFIFGERPEQFAHIAHHKWGNEQILIDRERIAQVAHDKWATISDLLRSLMINEQMCDSLKQFWQKKSKILFFRLFNPNPPDGGA